MTLIDLGEASSFEPGEVPLLRRYRLLPPHQRRKAVVVAMLILAAGAFGGLEPRPDAEPRLNHVGPLRAELVMVHGDIAVAYDDRLADITAYAMDGSGPRWRLPADQPPSVIDTAGDLVLISFTGLSFLESTTNTATDLPPRMAAVDAATGKERWAVSGWPIGPVSGPIALVVSDAVGGRAGRGRIAGIDTRTGLAVWDEPLTGTPLLQLADDGRSQRTDEFVMVDEDGTVRRISYATGRTQPAGRIAAGAQPAFEWRDLLAAVRPLPGDTHREFLVYRLGADRPLWRHQLSANEPGYSPCGEHLCSFDSSGYYRIDPLTGRLLARFGHEAPDPYLAGDDPWQAWRGAQGLGRWEPVAMYAGHALVRLDPSYAQDGQSWLGEATLTGQAITVRPLMGLGPRSNSCDIESDWLFCNGSAVDDAVSVRLSELDRLL